MSFITSALKKISVESTQYRSAVSEFVLQTMGGTINALIDKFTNLQTSLNGNPISYVQPVYFTGSYTVPTGYNFAGTYNARITQSGTNVTALLSITGSSGQTISASSAFSGSGQSGGFNDGVFGFIYKTVNITV